MYKIISLLLALALLCTCLTGCSNAGTPAQNKTESTGNTTAEPKPVEDYSIEDVLGCWYGEDSDGNIYSLRIAGSGNFHSFTLTRFGNEIWECSGSYQLVSSQDENGNPAGDIGMVILHTVDGESTADQQANIHLLDNGTLRYSPLHLFLDKLIAANGKEAADRLAAKYDLIFSRNLPVTTFKITEQTLNGLWYGEEDGSSVLLMATTNGNFVLWENDGGVYPTTGTYKKDATGVTFTAKTIEGEEYTGDDAVVTLQMNEDDSLLGANDQLISPVQCGVSGHWTTEFSGKTMSLDIFSSGIFRLSDGNSEAVGLCLCDGENISLLFLMNGGYNDFTVNATGTVEADGSLLLTNLDGSVLNFAPGK